MHLKAIKEARGIPAEEHSHPVVSRIMESRSESSKPASPTMSEDETSSDTPKDDESKGPGL